MALRNLLLALIVVATAAFVVGTSVERTSGESGHDPAVPVKPVAGENAAAGKVHAEATGESAATHAKESAPSPAATTTEKPHPELRPLGINVESWPFVAIAALVSLAFGLAAWLRPRLAGLLRLVVVVMFVFVALDVGEVVHQSGIDKTSSAVLAGVVAALHLAAAVLAAAMARRALRSHSGPATAAGTMPA